MKAHPFEIDKCTWKCIYFEHLNIFVLDYTIKSYVHS